MTDLQPGLLLQGVVLGLSIAAPIGPVNVAMIQRGLSRGFAGAFLLGLGSTLADLLYILLAYAGADPLSHQPWARIALFAAGALVMGYLGYGALRAAFAPAAPEASGTPERRSAFVSGFLITIVNPMTIAFWLGILSASLASRPRGTVLLEALYIAALALGCVLWCFALSLALHFGRRVAKGPGLRIVSFAAGLMLVWFGLQFAFKAVKEMVPGGPGEDVAAEVR
jgi:threonine/homoserine/homoserine lactone efflux protein